MRMRKVKYSRNNGGLDYVLYLLSTTILGVPAFCGLMEILKGFICWIM